MLQSSIVEKDKATALTISCSRETGNTISRGEKDDTTLVI